MYAEREENLNLFVGASQRYTWEVYNLGVTGWDYCKWDHKHMYVCNAREIADINT